MTKPKPTPPKPTDPARHLHHARSAMPKPGEMLTPTNTLHSIRNSTMQSIYDGAELRTVVRDKSDDHERHPSRYSDMRVWRSGRQERA